MITFNNLTKRENFALVGRNGIKEQKFQKTHLNSKGQASLFKMEWVALSSLHVIRKEPEDLLARDSVRKDY